MGILDRITRRRKRVPQIDAADPLATISPYAQLASQSKLPEAAIDPESAARSNDLHASFRSPRERSSMQHERGFSVIVAPLRVEEGNGLQAFLLGTCNNIGIVAQWVGRLGLPPTSVTDKMPYWR